MGSCIASGCTCEQAPTQPQTPPLEGIRKYTKCSPEYGDLHMLDLLVDITPGEGKTIVKMSDYYHKIETMLDDDYTILRLIFTSNNVATSRYLYYTPSGEVEEHVMDEGEHESSILFTRFILWCDSICNDLPKAIEDVVKLVNKKLEEEKLEDEEEICVICHEKYQADSIIGALPCKHSYHATCIKNWLMEKNMCPICRGNVFRFE